MTSTQIKKLNAYPEWNSLPSYIQVMNYINTKEEEQPQYPSSTFGRLLLDPDISHHKIKELLYY